MERPKFKGHLKLLVLHLLSKEPMHGYAIMKGLEERFGIPAPSAGVIYPILFSLKRAGLIETIGTGQREKKIYKITENGIEYLKEHEDELKEAIKLARIYREFSEMGGKELREAFKLIFDNFDNLTEKQKEELSKIIREFAKRIKFIVEFGGSYE
ncbi:PadR family transcriptional regulator [Thermococcus sp. M39]|uniref:PadR family transcriptional regulator n=1 Tax=unclassified Thermococcus TaxID=2627626 RepID=UPI001439A064|nr:MULTISPECIES: PadR family transcriptional regulator [unclassified Thermococcus]NJE08843.1 PadR family transcriptional regulator [Thermococcus sp. M39]NJE13504.1 PadR family transcriptional regulator [Thermococcus sp. LS2]